MTEGLNKIGKNALVVLREPSLGPVFGIKGGAAGGGYSQVVPMEDINLHFTGDFAAIEKANNLLAALIDNNIQSKTRNLNIDPRTVLWKRVIDMNDRSLRHVVVGLGGTVNGIPREGGFNITAASEIMAILCMSKDITDLKENWGIFLLDLHLIKSRFTQETSMHRSHGITTERCNQTKLGSNLGRQCRNYSWWAIRKHRTRNQYHFGYENGYVTIGLCRD